MKKQSWRHLLAIAALVVAPMGAVTLYATPAAAEGVSDCLRLENGTLFNRCTFTVEAAWCTENVDCRNGYYTNLWTIRAGGYVYPQGGNSGNTVRWGACRGANTLSWNGAAAYSYEFFCAD